MSSESNGLADALAQLALAATDAASMSALAEVLSRAAAPQVGAANAAFGVIADRNSALRIYQGPTATAGNAEIRMHPLADITPLTDAIRTRQPVLVSSPQQFSDEYPLIARRTKPGEVEALAAYPLELGDDMFGACFFRFAHGCGLNEQRLEAMEKLLPFLVRGIARIQDRAELVAYANRLEQSNDDLENFAAVVAHDLSAPVRRIGSFLQLLEREVRPLNDKAQRYADTVQAQVRHLDQLLRDTLAYAHVTAPSRGPAPTSLTKLVSEVVAPLRPELVRASASVEVGEMPVLEIEASMVHQVFENLIENAVKYRHANRAPVIDIAAEPLRVDEDEPRTWWRISVSDNGIGIDPDRYGDVFSMFSRLEVSNDRPGTGVGLAFVKRVVERHGGEIGIEPAQSGGTTFWFTLPGPVEHDVL